MATKRKTALSKSPTTKPAAKPAPSGASKWVRTGPGQYKDQYGNVKKGQAKAPTANKAPGATTGATPGTAKPQPTDAQRFAGLSPEQQGNEMADVSGQFGKDILGRAGQFDPNNPWANVQQQGFSDQMEAARQNTMAQFERSMGPEFQRQDAEFNQRMAEQGIDPNSGAYQAQYKAMKDAQNNARLNAQSQAFQLGSQYQQQGYEQFMGGQKLPFEQYAATEKMWTLPYTASAEATQAEKTRQAQLQQARIGAGASVAGARIGAESAQNIAAMQGMQNYQTQQQPSFGSSLAQGIGQVLPIVAMNYAKGSK
jgi:hypothetical protein